jgi:hypothetical protein
VKCIARGSEEAVTVTAKQDREDGLVGDGQTTDAQVYLP